MHISEVLIAIIVVVISDHLFRLAFKAHAFVASAASDSIAAIESHNRHFAAGVRTLADAIFLHVLLKCGITSLFGLLTSQTWMVVHFAFDAVHLLTLVAAEMVFNEKVHLFAPGCVAVRYYLWIATHILVQGHATQFGPCFGGHKLLQVDDSQLS